MTAPTPQEVIHDLRVGFPETRRSALIQEAIDALAAVTAERDQARQMLEHYRDEEEREGWRALNKSSIEEPKRTCAVPPPGWLCTREEGHVGPCAARPVPYKGDIDAYLGKVEVERDQARQRLADAPHEEGCMLGFIYEDGSVGTCDCWKAGL